MHGDDDILLDRKKNIQSRSGNGKMVLGNFLYSFFLSLVVFIPYGRGWKAGEVDLLKW